MLFYARPSVHEFSAQACVVKIPLLRRNRNHVGSMYFAVLAMGADVAGGFIAMRRIKNEKLPVTLVFKDIKGEFLRRADSHVYFTCSQGAEIHALVDKTMESGEREEMPVHIVASSQPHGAGDVFANFTLTLSLKARRRVIS